MMMNHVLISQGNATDVYSAQFELTPELRQCSMSSFGLFPLNAWSTIHHCLKAPVVK